MNELELNRYDRELKEKERLASFVADVGLALVEENTLQVMLRRCTEAMVARLEAAFARIWTLDVERNVLVLQASAGMYTHLDGPHGTVPVGKFKIGLIAEEKKPHLTNAVVGDSRVGDQEWAKREGMVAFAGYPLIVEDRLVGVMAMFARHPLTEATLQSMASVANGVAVGIERKASEERLQDAEKNYRSVAETASDAILTINQDSTIKFVNPAAEQIFGYSSDEMLDADLTMLMPEYFRELHRRGMHRYLETGQKHIPWHGVELIALRKDGREFPVEVSFGESVKDGKRTFTGIIRDITARKRSERHTALQHAVTTIVSEAPSLEAAAPDITRAMGEKLGWDFAAMWVADDETDTLRCLETWHAEKGDDLAAFSAKTRQITFSRGSGLLGHVWESGKPAVVEDVLNERDFLRRALAEEHSIRSATVFPIQMADQISGVFELLTREPVALDEELMGTMLAIGQQVGQFIKRKRAEEELRASEREYRVLAAELAKLNRERAEQNELLEVKVAERTAALQEANSILTREIDERRKAEQLLQKLTVELERSNRELQDFASVASHDLQEPLRKIQAFGDRLQARFAPELTDEARDYIQRMQTSASRMKNLINDLLVFSRVTTMARPFHPVNLDIVVRNLLNDLEVRLSQTKGRVEIGKLPTIEADPVQMHQLFLNLIANSLKFHQPGLPPIVEVRWIETNGPNPRQQHSAAGDNLCTIVINDNGIGFDEKYLDRIFTPFQRLHARGEYEGTGMGLAICRKIVERHGGTITARSVPSEGTRFIVNLPFKQEVAKEKE